jgi:hypothetical protein
MSAEPSATRQNFSEDPRDSVKIGGVSARGRCIHPDRRSTLGAVKRIDQHAGDRRDFGGAFVSPSRPSPVVAEESVARGQTVAIGSTFATSTEMAGGKHLLENTARCGSNLRDHAIVW